MRASIIRVATRSAYAEVCQLPEFEKANFDAMIRAEKLRGWTAEQMMFIHALHTFATSYFAGNVKITSRSDAGQSGDLAKEGAAAANAAKGDATTITTKKLECAPGQKEKVMAAINTYVQSDPPRNRGSSARAPGSGGGASGGTRTRPGLQPWSSGTGSGRRRRQLTLSAHSV